MANNVLDTILPEELDDFGAETAENRASRLRERMGAIGRRLASPFTWLWERIVLAWRWLIRPDEVGQPITLRPRGLQVLLLLIVGNLVIVGGLGYALYRTATAPAAESSPPPALATSTTAPLPTSGVTPTPLGSGGAIAFTLRRNGNVDIYALNQIDRQVVRLTDDLAVDRDPAWSSDGQLLAYTSNRANNWDIYILDLISGTPIRLTQSSGFDANPSWSPDGEYIAYESYRYGNLDIYVMSTTGGEVQRITTSRAPDYEPAWSPDGRAIAFTSFRDGNKDIHLYFVDEETTINLTNSPGVNEDHAVWSPDGTRLAYTSGSRGNPSIQVTTFQWDAETIAQTQTELLGAGTSPAWAPDGQSLTYAYAREGRSYLIAASMTGWAVSQEVYSTDGLMDDLAWTEIPLSPRVIARAQSSQPSTAAPLFVELVQPTPSSGPPYELVPLLNIKGVREEEQEEEEEDTEDTEGTEDTQGLEETPEPEETPEVEETFLLSDRVDESFNALRQRVIDETGWDYMGTLNSSWVPMTFTPPSGHSRMSWHVCGRAIGLDRRPYAMEDPQIELVREDAGSVTYWRIFIRATEQNGSMGEPLREAVWDLYARDEEGRAFVEGGAIEDRIPSGYYVDFTTLAGDYGWERLPSMWRWRYSWPDVLWWEFRKTGGLDWWGCMLEVFEPDEIEDAFGPIPGVED